MSKETKTTQPTQTEMFEQVLRENARLREALNDKANYEFMEQLKLLVEVYKSGIFGNDVEATTYLQEKIKSAVVVKEVKEEPVTESGF
jgi:PDZ domain-containing secreted protein